MVNSVEQFSPTTSRINNNFNATPLIQKQPNIPKLPNSPGRLNSPFGSPFGARQFEDPPKPKDLFTTDQSKVSPYKPKLPYHPNDANEKLFSKTTKKFGTNR